MRYFSKINKKLWINLLSLFFLYFIQAMPFGFQSRYMPLVMRKRGVSITSLGLFKLLLVPWVFKVFVAAFLVDVYRTKRFWLLSSLLVLALGSFSGTLFSEDFSALAVILFVLNWASATQDICVDWFAMNALEKEDLGIGNTVQVGAFKLGTLFSGGLLVFLMDYISIAQTFAILGSIYLVSLFVLNMSFFKSESSSHHKELKSESDSLSFVERFRQLHRSPGTYWICAFVLIYKLGEQSSLNILPIYLLDRKVESSTIGLWTGIIGQSFSICGSFIGGIMIKKAAKKFNTYQLLKYCTFIRLLPIFTITFLIAFQENISSNKLEGSVLAGILFFVQLQLFLSGLLTTFTFTTMMECSFLAPKHIQASHFSLLATCEVFGKLLFQPFISMFTDYSGFSDAFFLFSILYLITTFLFLFRPKIFHNTPKLN